LVVIFTHKKCLAKKVGVKVYLPSDFGLDYDNMGGHEFGRMSEKSRHSETARDLGLKTVCITTGGFMDLVFHKWFGKIVPAAPLFILE
jgi:hypothetical protein